MDSSKAQLEHFMQKPVPKSIRTLLVVDENFPQQNVRIVDKRKEVTIH
jgi:hypothetical protein